MSGGFAATTYSGQVNGHLAQPLPQLLVGETLVQAIQDSLELRQVRYSGNRISYLHMRTLPWEHITYQISYSCWFYITPYKCRYCQVSAMD